MEKIFATKLKAGDEVRVVAPSQSLGIISVDTREIANKRFADMGLKLSFGEHVEEMDGFASSSIESRVADIHTAFKDPNVSMVIAVIGGFNCNQLLKYLDWDLIKANPKIFCGYSDTTALQNAIFAKTGLVTYSGPAYSSFGQKLHFDFTLEHFQQCIFSDDPIALQPSTEWSDDRWYKDQINRNLMTNDGWWPINGGEASGTLLGGNLCTLNLLQGTEFMPDLDGAILFLEDDELSNRLLFDRDLQSVLHQPNFKGVKALVIGRFQDASTVTREALTQIIKSKKELGGIPVIANVDFGHTDPKITFPVGGEVRLSVGPESKIEIAKH